MANILQTRLTLFLNGGFDAEGKEILTKKTFSNLDITATDLQLMNTVTALATLQQYTLGGVSRFNEYDIYNG